MNEPTNLTILNEISEIKALMDGIQKSRADQVDDLLFSALLILTQITNEISEPNFTPENTLVHCNRLRSFLTDASLVLGGTSTTQ